MCTRIALVVGLFVLLSGVCIAPLRAMSHQEIQDLLDQYGKYRLTRAILLLKENQITVFTNGRYVQFNGPPSLEFVNVETLLIDLEKTGTDVKQLRKILQGLPQEPKTTKTLTMKSEPRAAPPITTPQEPEEVELPKPPPSEEKPQSDAAEGTPPASATLREAAMNCQVTAFSNHMSPSTGERVQRFEDIGAGIAKALDDLYARTSGLYSDRIERSHDAIRFKIKGEDPRWVDILGPQWANMLKTTPEESRYFLIEVTFGWQEECKVLQTFLTCLEDPQLCHSEDVKDSALRIEEDQSFWRLADAKPSNEWEQAFKFGQGITDILQWAEQFIVDTSGGKLPYEELMISLAAGYFQRLQGLMQEIERMAEGAVPLGVGGKGHRCRAQGERCRASS